MALKTVFILSACLALALGAAIEPSSGSDLSNLTNNFSSGLESGAGGLNTTNFAPSNIIDGFQNVGDRLQNAFNETYQEEKNSVSDSFNSIKDRFHQDIETAGNLTKTAFDLGTVFPKFGKNLIIGDSN